MVKNSKKILKLKKKIKEIRYNFLKLISKGVKYHIGGSLSVMDIIVCLIYSNKIDLTKTSNIRNKLILSKGHALGIFYTILMDLNLLSEKKYFSQIKNNKFGGQLDTYNCKYVDWSTGSLGHSIGVSIGMALANPKKKIITIVGDAEIDEGSVWEGLFFISEKKIKNVHIIIDRNKLSASSFIEKKEVLDKRILNQLNLNVFRGNGHNLIDIFKYIKIIDKSKSSLAIFNTIKGNGIPEFENNLQYSHGQPDKKLITQVLKNLEN